MLDTSEARFDGRPDCSASFMTENDEERRIEVASGVLQTSGDLRRYAISRNPDYEELSKACVKDQLRRYSGVAASEDGCIRALPLRERGENIPPQGGKAAFSAQISLMAVFQALQRFVRRNLSCFSSRHVR
jgi:hypothetical protein